jgi:hypothetical protein
VVSDCAEIDELKRQLKWTPRVDALPSPARLLRNRLVRETERKTCVIIGAKKVDTLPHPSQSFPAFLQVDPRGSLMLCRKLRDAPLQRVDPVVVRNRQW